MRKVNYTAGILFLATLFSIQSFAQSSSAYIFFKPIYAFPSNKTKLSETSSTVQGVTYTKGVYGSYGRGLCYQAGIGKMINANFGFELGAEFLNGGHIKSTVNSQDDSISGNASERISSV